MIDMRRKCAVENLKKIYDGQAEVPGNPHSNSQPGGKIEMGR
jgi:hypothetical protein